MEITDLNGQKIEVTGLAAAISQAEDFKSYCHHPIQPAADEMMQAYWKDIYDKLIALKAIS